MHKKGMFRTLLAGSVLFSLLTFLAACGGGGDSGTAPGVSGTITLATSAASMPADGSSSVVITATVKDGAGNPVRHYTDVNFSTTLGYFRNGSTSYTVQTLPPLVDGKPDIKAAPTGIAEVSLRAGTTSGAAKVTVTSNGVSQSVYITISGSSAGITLTADPTSIPADGQSSTTITATLTDSAGNPVKPGTYVTFTTGLGHFQSDMKSYTVATADSTGIVKVAMQAGVVPGTTYIEATSNNITQALSIVLTKTDPLYAEITIEVNPARIAADGQSQSVITATVSQTRNVAGREADAAGQPISGIPITFYKITSNVEPQPLPEANTYKGTGTSIAGPFYSYGGLTTFYMTAVPSGTIEEYFTVWLFNPLSGERELLINRSNWGYTDTLIEEKGLSLLPGNYQLEIQTNCYYEIKVVGDIGAAQTGKTVLGFGKTDADGNAVHVYTADWLTGSFSVKAETGELSNSDNALSAETTLTQTQGTPEPIEIAAASKTIYANGETSTSITAQVWTQAGNKVPDGTVVYFSATSGSITATGVTVDGLASAELTSSPSSSSVVSTVTATVGATSASTTVTFLGVRLTDMQSVPATIFANGTDTSEISVRIRDANGAAVVGESVIFATTSGSIQTETVVTDSEGIAKTSLIAPTTPGNATVTAVYGLITAISNVTFTSSVPVGTITLTANPTSIPADGASSSTITATLRDTAGNPVAKGTSVVFTTTLGVFGGSGQGSYTVITPDENGVVSVSLIASTTTGAAKVTASSGKVSQDVYVTMGGATLYISLTASPTIIPADGSSASRITATLVDAGGQPVTPGTAVTFTTNSGMFSNNTTSITVSTPDNTGQVTASLTSSTTAGTATVTASANGVSQSINVTFGGTVVANISVTATPSSLTADGLSTSEIRAAATDAQGNPISDGQTITFTIISGTGSLSGASAATSGGYASVTYTAGNTAGSVVIRAMAASSVSDTVIVTLVSGVVGSITVTANPTSVPADGASSSAITAEIKDTAGKPVQKGFSAVFTTTLGKFSNGSTTQTASTADDTGIVTVSLIADADPGTATVTATSGGVSQTVEVEFTGAGEVDTIEVSANPASIPADGASTSTITALVKTADNQVVQGASVTFTTSRGSITSPHTSDANGQAKATLTSERYFDSSVMVTATCQGKVAYAFVQFTGVTLTLTANPVSLLVGNADGSSITATLKDAAGNPMANTSVIFSTDKGTLTPSTPQSTNASGQAFVKLTSNVSGAATVTARAIGAEGKVSVNFTRYDFRVEADPTTIRVGGETSQITALLLDQGVPKSGETIYFSTTLGTLNPYQQDTGADGKAVVTLTSGAQSGVAVIDASTTISGVTPATELFATTQVVITGGAAAKIVLTADPDIITTNTGVSAITATVYDANDQPAPDQKIYFRVNTGPGGGERLSASVKTTDSYGVAIVSFYAGSLASTLKGVEIEANTASDFTGSYGLATLTIAGPVANIGVGMNLETLEPDGGNLKIDISGIATDVNGNPVADGTKIYFAVIAVEFDEDRANDLTIDCWDENRNPLIPCPAVGTPGFGYTWFSDDVNQDGTMYSLGGPMSTTEDVNHNGILDPGEDKNDNGVIDPIQGCVIDDVVETTDGVAKATLFYPMPQANNIRVRVTAEAGGVSNFYETILLCTETMVEQGTCGIAY